MPKVVPSQVVQTIDLLFPWAKKQKDTKDDRKSIQFGATNQAAAIVKLAEDIPGELLMMEPDVYARFLTATSALKNQIIQWNSAGNVIGNVSQLERIYGLGDLHPITIIRNALVTCPDEAPYTGTTELDFIKDAELRDSIWVDISAVRRALINQEWKAATVLSGSAIEVLLLWALSEKTQAVIDGAVNTLLTKKIFSNKPPTNTEEWNLYQYIHVCSELGLISNNTLKQTELAKDFRNLIHPGRAARLRQQCDRGSALSAVAGIEHVIRDLTNSI